MVPAELLLVQGFGEDALELAAEGVGHEFLDVHDGHVVFATEPMAGLADFGAAGVDVVFEDFAAVGDEECAAFGVGHLFH